MSAWTPADTPAEAGPDRTSAEPGRGGRGLLGRWLGLRPTLGFLTIVPVTAAAGPLDLIWPGLWFPVVGFGLGGILVPVVMVSDVLFPPAVSAVLTLGVWVLVTGGLHLDGLADSLDGLGGGWSRPDALRLMREGGIGAYGATGLILVLGLKAAALSSLTDTLLWRAVLVAPVLGRLAPVVLAQLCPPARPDGAGRAFVSAVTPATAMLGALVAGSTAVGLLGAWGILLLALTVVQAGTLGVYLRTRLGGLTGDCLGAAVELAEAVALLVVAGLASAELA